MFQEDDKHFRMKSRTIACLTDSLSNIFLKLLLNYNNLLRIYFFKLPKIIRK